MYDRFRETCHDGDGVALDLIVANKHRAGLEAAPVTPLSVRRELTEIFVLSDVKPAAVEKERVFAKQLVELWNQRMIVGNRRASNWSKVRSSCAELSLIARSFRFPPHQSALSCA